MFRATGYVADIDFGIYPVKAVSETRTKYKVSFPVQDGPSTKIKMATQEISKKEIVASRREALNQVIESLEKRILDTRSMLDYWQSIKDRALEELNETPMEK